MLRHHLWQGAVSPTCVLGVALGIGAYLVLREDPRPDAEPQGFIRTPGAGPIYALAYAPDGGTLATGALHDRVRIWTPATGKPLGAFVDQAYQTSALAYSPDSKTLAIAEIDSSAVNAWDLVVRALDTGAVEAVLHGHSDKITELAFAPDGKTLASASLDRTVRLWDRATNRPPVVINGTRPFHCMAFAPDGKTLLTGGGEGAVRRWDATTGQPLGIVIDHLSTIHRMALSPDGSTLATWEIGQLSVRLWDTSTGTLQAVARGHTGFIQALAFAPDGRTLASAGLDGTIRLWDAVTCRVRATLYGPEHVGIHSLAFAPDGKTLVSGGSGASLIIWDLQKTTNGTIASKEIWLGCR